MADVQVYVQDGEQVSNSANSNIGSGEGNIQPQQAHSLRLFVGWVPKVMTEQELVGLFTQVRPAQPQQQQAGRRWGPLQQRLLQGSRAP
jgi:hypothetical protein